LDQVNLVWDIIFGKFLLAFYFIELCTAFASRVNNTLFKQWQAFLKNLFKYWNVFLLGKLSWVFLEWCNFEKKKKCFEKNSCWTSGRIFYRHKISNLDEKKISTYEKKRGRRNSNCQNSESQKRSELRKSKSIRTPKVKSSRTPKVCYKSLKLPMAFSPFEIRLKKSSTWQDHFFMFVKKYCFSIFIFVKILFLFRFLN